MLLNSEKREHFQIINSLQGPNNTPMSFLVKNFETQWLKFVKIIIQNELCNTSYTEWVVQTRL